jgi:hypothetical protein
MPSLHRFGRTETVAFGRQRLSAPGTVGFTSSAAVAGTGFEQQDREFRATVKLINLKSQQFGIWVGRIAPSRADDFYLSI